MVLYSLKESCIRGWYLAKNVSLNTKISKNKIIIKRLVSTAFPVNLKSSLSFGNLRCEQIGNRLNFYNKHGTNMHDIRCWTCLSMFDWIINSSFFYTNYGDGNSYLCYFLWILKILLSFGKLIILKILS